jgi:putative oxidoreductase
MKSILSHPLVILFLRILLGGLFVLASLDKIADPNAFAMAVSNYKIVNADLALLVATVLPIFEFLCGTLLILGIFPQTNAALITGLLTAFTIMIISALIRGLDISCGCFTQDPDAGKIGYLKIVENSGMILVGIILMLQPSTEYSILHFIAKQPAPHKL